MNYKNCIFISIFLFVFLLGGNSVSAAQCSATWTEYSCGGSDCGDDILSRECWEYCNAWEEECEEDCTTDPETGEEVCEEDCWDVCVGCGVECGSSSVYDSCDNWQVCRNGGWSTSIPECQCEGSCLEAPENPRYYDNPTYPADPDDPEESLENTDIKLPVKLDWDDAEYWQADPDGPQSYRITIENTRPNDPYSDYAITSEFVAPSCTLKSSTAHNWRVQACCSLDGTNCQEDLAKQLQASFTTSLTPEPILPSDPDWQGPEKTEGYPLPALLSWCEVPLAQSYYLSAYKNGEPHLPWPITKKDGELLPQYFDEAYNFTAETIYQWEVATCLNEDVTKCGLDCRDDQFPTECATFSQRWIFLTGEMLLLPPARESPAYDPTEPTEIPAVNQLDSLKWKSVLEAHFYRYQIKKGEEIVVDETIDALEGLEVKFSQIDPLWDSIEKFDQIYSWRVASCWGKEKNQCGEFSEPSWFFQTTGAKPVNLSEDVRIIPVKLGWKDMPGAASYYYEVATAPGFSNVVIPEPERVIEKSEVLVDYPLIKQNTTYWWRVKTCADREGKICGNWSDVKSFTTFTLAEPVPSRPKEGEEFYTYERYLRWDEVAGARAYQYRVYYGGVEKIPLTRVYTNSAFVDTPRQLELGEHTWEVQACLDKNCQETGSFGGPWSFEVVAKVPPGGAGLVPCGRDVDMPDPYDIDETESCGFQHIFLLLRNILDFVLWRLGLIILVLLALYSGIIFYFSGQLGVPDPLPQVKSLWKAAGMGYLIVFLSYTVVNIFLNILGYKIGIFGPWWQISF